MRLYVVRTHINALITDIALFGVSLVRVYGIYSTMEKALDVHNDLIKQKIAKETDLAINIIELDEIPTCLRQTEEELEEPEELEESN